MKINVEFSNAKEMFQFARLMTAQEDISNLVQENDYLKSKVELAQLKINDAYAKILKLESKGNEVDLKTDIIDLDLTVRSYNCLKSENIENVEQLVQYHRSHDLRKIPNLGRGSFKEIADTILERFKITL